MDKEKSEVIAQAAMLHDIGKIGIRDSVLQKKGKLTDEEYHHIQDHVRITHDILSKIADKSESFKDVVEIAASHHEKFNGAGYPEQKKGTDIPLEARIMAVADVFDAVSEKRCYRDALPLDTCFGIIADGRGRDFDPDLVDIFLRNKEKVIEIHGTPAPVPESV